MQNLQEGHRGSQLRGLECPVWAQIPALALLPGPLGLGGKTQMRRKQFGRKADDNREKLSSQKLEERPLVGDQENGCP